MKILFPKKLQRGDEIRVIAPACSLGIIAKQSRDIAAQRFSELGLKLTFGKHVNEQDDFESSSIASRIADLHDAFADKHVQAVISVIGGFNSNQLLRYIDWKLIQKNPKVFCGFSDITALNNALFAKTGLVNYSGPAYASFGQKLYFDYTFEYFKKCIFSDKPFLLKASDSWSDDTWYLHQDDRVLIQNNGYHMIHEGKASGTIIGGNLCTLNLLQGTPYFPDLKNSILFLEDDEETKPVNFDRDLQSLLHVPSFVGVRGLVIGRFQKVSKMSPNILEQIIASKAELKNIPVVANVDFGHTSPLVTFPIGGTVELAVSKKISKIKIIKH